MKSLLGLWCLFCTVSAFAGETIERYGLFVGSNQGGKGTAALKYAASDARKVQDVLVRMGGLKEENSLLLVNPGKDNLFQGIEFLRSKIEKNRQKGLQIQMIFYYSGHSDEQGFLLGGERVVWPDLKAQLGRLEADVQIVVLDSCSSGAFTRSKGGQISAPFLQDLSTEVEGHAFLTSSTAEEASQESDRIESSFFTRALVEGLRGAADANGDGQVTLNEAYEYAYAETTADTQATTSGTQHPAFDIQLTGKGNLVMTDLRTGGPALSFPEGMQGRITVRDIANKLVAEVAKVSSKELTLGVTEGFYLVRWESHDLLETTVLVNEPRTFAVDPAAFHAVDKTKNPTRGPGSELTYDPVGFILTNEDGKAEWVLNLFGGRAQALDGGMQSLIYNRTIESSSGFQGALFANFAVADFQGFQGTFGANQVGGDFIGIQSGWLYDGIGGRLSGLQVGGINMLDGDGKYLQLGIWNQAQAQFVGLQAGLLFNFAHSMQGVQIGLVNVSDEQTGVQIGLVNFSKNLKGLPIGLLDIQLNGLYHLDETVAVTGQGSEVAKNLALTTVVRFGSEYFYKYLALGTLANGYGTEEGVAPLSLGAGLGARAPVFFPGFALQLDAGVNYAPPGGEFDFRTGSRYWQGFYPQLRLFASWTFWQNLGVLAGWECPVFPPYFSEVTGSDKLNIRTNQGTYLVAARFFLGLQL